MDVLHQISEDQKIKIMKTTIRFLFTLTIIPFCTCVVLNANPPDNRNLPVKTDTLHSKILNERRNIWVYVPASYDTSSNQSYPVAYLLDGDAQFYTVLTIIRQLSEENMNMVLPQMILVGILNTDRMRDLTPSHVSYDPDIPDSSYVRTSGGSENFTSFIEKELVPYIESKYPAAPYRILIGHSDGGLFCISTMLNHTNLFNGYLAIDPNIKWDNNMILNIAKETLKHKTFEGISFYMAIANQGYSDSDTYKENAASFELAKLLDSDKSIKLRYKWQYYNDDNHSSVPLISEYDGLRYLFDFYNPRIPYTKFRDPEFSSDLFLIEHYKKVSSMMGYNVSPPESVINWLGYLFVMEKQYDMAFKMMKLNTDNYPTSWNAFDSLGEVLMILGKTAAAIENFEKSLTINPNNANARKMIEQLKQKK
jgi:predicted alpha/beta superfamily hydrolase